MKFHNDDMFPYIFRKLCHTFGIEMNRVYSPAVRQPLVHWEPLKSILLSRLPYNRWVAGRGAAALEPREAQRLWEGGAAAALRALQGREKMEGRRFWKVFQVRLLVGSFRSFSLFHRSPGSVILACLSQVYPW